MCKQYQEHVVLYTCLPVPWPSTLRYLVTYFICLHSEFQTYRCSAPFTSYWRTSNFAVGLENDLDCPPAFVALLHFQSTGCSAKNFSSVGSVLIPGYWSYSCDANTSSIVLLVFTWTSLVLSVCLLGFEAVIWARLSDRYGTVLFELERSPGLAERTRLLPLEFSSYAQMRCHHRHRWSTLCFYLKRTWVLRCWWHFCPLRRSMVMILFVLSS